MVGLGDRLMYVLVDFSCMISYGVLLLIVYGLVLRLSVLLCSVVVSIV